MKRRYLLALLPTLLLFSGMASADTLTVNCSTVTGPTELVAAPMFCPQFNLGPGFALSNIGIAVSGGINGSITLMNGSTATQTGSGTTTTSFAFGALSGFTFVNPIFQATYTTGTQTLSAGQTLTVSGLTGTGSGSLGSNATSFAAYTGSGNFIIPVSTSTLFSAGGTGGSFTASQASNANATGVVTYTFSAVQAVPEPATISLLGLGLLGFRFMARKFKVVK